MEYSDNIIMVRFGELSTKGKNMHDFIHRLGINIKVALSDYKNLKYRIEHDHIYIELHGEDFAKVSERLKKVPGLSSFSLVEAVKRDMEEVKTKALEMARKANKKTFKVITKRTDKLFPLISDQINREVGGYILRNIPSIKVDVHEPELEIHITVRDDAIYMYSDSIQGIGGYPVGIQGKGLVMLSGGIDSPVAAYLMMKRGVKIEAIHFAAPPYTSDQVLVKIRDLLKVLNIYQPDIKLYIVPFTDIQKKIYDVAGSSYAITIMRRMMLRIAIRIARSHKDTVIANGESIGQVASQTLKSISAIERGMNYPVIRPLATYDKVDIMKIAQDLGTFDISIRPYEDCCTIFDVKDPTTCPHYDRVDKIETGFDYNSMIEEAIKNIQIEHITAKDEKPF
jgi:thiamine biosynthesis protein ThiI